MLRNLAALGQALSDETRLRILKLLAQRELCVCELEAVLGMTQSRVSTNLAVLRNAGLVRDRRDGRWVFYSLDRDTLHQQMTRLTGFLTRGGLSDIPEMASEAARWPSLDQQPGVAACLPPSFGVVTQVHKTQGEPA
ncbi:MAG: metalloregulator ArsR/SmtB family transcription factor [Chloroflexota bacterium]|nr:metalloregulator ArsR/SmtB family transcription factor [Chloroflexota bacterium]